MRTVAGSRDNSYKMCKKALTIVGAFLCGIIGQAQSISGDIRINDGSAHLFLEEVIGGKGYVIDSCKVTPNNYIFDLSGKPFGYYRLRISAENRVDFIYDGKSIVMDFLSDVLQDNLLVKESDVNKLLWTYKYYSREVGRLNNAYIIQQSYEEKGSDTWRKLQYQRDSITKVKNDYLDSLCRANSGSMFSLLVGATQREKYLLKEENKEHYFDNIDFTNPVLLRSSIFPSVIMTYLQEYTDYSEAGFLESVDLILSLSSANQENYEFCLNFLLELFHRVGPDVVFQYLVETYLLDEGCGAMDVSDQIGDLANNYRALLPGNRAPLFAIPDTSNVIHELETELVKANTTVLYFWSSHCTFCESTTPKLIEWKEINPTVQIIAISLDENGAPSSGSPLLRL